jgi:signal transduction histidine kinase
MLECCDADECSDANRNGVDAEGSTVVGRLQMPWAVRSWFRSPRTVRMRLTLLCGGVILLSGGALVAIAFAIGGHQVSGGGHVLSSGIANLGLPSGALSAKQNGTTIIAGQGTSSGMIFAQVTQSAARIGSSRAVGTLLLWAILGLGIVTALGLLLGWALSGRMLRPLRTIRDTTRRISEANLHERLALTGPQGDELRDLGDTIDGLLGRLETAFEAQRRFVQNAAHELRTPITMMRTSLDVATGKPIGVTPEVGVLAHRLGEGLDQAERLLEGFLALTRAQTGAVGDRVPLSLPDVVAATLEARADVATALGLHVAVELSDATTIGSATLVPQIVVNLVDNAIRHNEPGGWVRVTTKTLGVTVRLVVENSGALLDQARVKELGQPFHRLVDRTASDRGAGLGLSIVAAIVEAEGGAVTLRARAEGGLHVAVDLPSAHLAEPAETR